VGGAGPDFDAPSGFDGEIAAGALRLACPKKESRAMLRRFHPVMACAAWLTATGAMAQTAAPSVDRQAFDFVQAYSVSTPKIDQIARWKDPLCVAVVGLPPDQAAQIKARIEDVAKAVGVTPAPAGCTGNVQIAFAAQPQRLVDNYVKGREWILGYNYLDASAKTVTRPIQAWYVTATVGAGGGNTGWQFAYTGVPSQVAGNPAQLNDKVIDRPGGWSPTGRGDSTLTSGLRSEIVNVFAVVDTSKAESKSVGVLSDYLAMLVLSQPRSIGACQPLPSVTDLFVEGCAGGAPDGLTAADAAFLTALYQANPEARKVNMQSDIAGRMARMLTSSSVVAR
jgi:hypothetical protein